MTSNKHSLLQESFWINIYHSLIMADDDYLNLVN